jgi:hypothetical protein
MALDSVDPSAPQWVAMEIGKRAPSEVLLELLGKVGRFRAFLESKATLLMSINNIDAMTRKRRKRQGAPEERNPNRPRFSMSFME